MVSSINRLLVNYKTELTENSYNTTTTNALNVEIIFLHTICHNCDMFLSVLIVFRELLNISVYKNVGY
jgi:hypothetical protein